MEEEKKKKKEKKEKKFASSTAFCESVPEELEQFQSVWGCGA